MRMGFSVTERLRRTRATSLRLGPALSPLSYRGWVTVFATDRTVPPEFRHALPVPVERIPWNANSSYHAVTWG